MNYIIEEGFGAYACCPEGKTKVEVKGSLKEEVFKFLNDAGGERVVFEYVDGSIIYTL
jgi:hypothetical protein